MEEEIVLVAKSSGPEEGEIRRVAGCEEADMWARGQLCKERWSGGAAERWRIERVDEDVVWRIGRMTLQLIEDRCEYFPRLAAESGGKRAGCAVEC